MSILDFYARHRYPNGFTLHASFELNHPVTALVGPSGSGKTTILKMIAGLIQPQESRIAMNNRILSDTEKRIHLPVQQRNTGVIFQDYLLFPHMTAEKNLRYGYNRRQSKSLAIDFQHLITVLKLQNLLPRYPGNLSGGEQQRVAIGRALLMCPDMLLMDEPLSSLDDSLKNNILIYLERILEEWKIPVLLVSHEVNEIQRLADWVITLSHGQVTGQGKPQTAWDTASSKFA